MFGGQRQSAVALPPPSERDAGTIYRRLGGPPGPVWKGAENLAPTGIRSPDGPARSELLLYKHQHLNIDNRKRIISFNCFSAAALISVPESQLDISGYLNLVSFVHSLNLPNTYVQS